MAQHIDYLLHMPIFLPTGNLFPKLEVLIVPYDTDAYSFLGLRVFAVTPCFDLSDAPFVGCSETRVHRPRNSPAPIDLTIIRVGYL